MTEENLEPRLTPPGDEEKAIVNTENSDTDTKVDEATGTDPDTNKPDKYLVDWDGPDDPDCPINWTFRKKWFNLAIVSINTLVTYGIPKCILN